MSRGRLGAAMRAAGHVSRLPDCAPPMKRGVASEDAPFSCRFGSS